MVVVVVVVMKCWCFSFVLTKEDVKYNQALLLDGNRHRKSVDTIHIARCISITYMSVHIFNANGLRYCVHNPSNVFHPRLCRIYFQLGF